jgi:hypothetical protein
LPTDPAQLQKIRRLGLPQRTLRLEILPSLLQCADPFVLVQVFRGFGRFPMLPEDFAEVK